MEKYCTFYIVRHGQAELNRDKIVMGQLDSPLTETGKAEAAAIRDELKHVKFDAVYASDLQRALETARIIAGPAVHIHTDRDLRERTFGSLQGRPHALLQTLRGDGAGDGWDDKVAPDAESNAEVFARVQKSIMSVAHKNGGKTVLVVTHSGPIRVLLAGLGFSEGREVAPGSIRNGQYIVVEIGDKAAKFRGLFPKLPEPAEPTSE